MFKLYFDFKDREEFDFNELNAILGAMKLTSLDLKDIEGYWVITRDGDGNLLHRQYGFDSGVLIGTRPMYGEKGYQYQIAAAVISASVDPDEFIQIWRDLHPNRVIEKTRIGGNEELRTFVIIHHQEDC